jgi:Carbohydrate esterase, sialic acid-specific acetylesterase
MRKMLMLLLCLCSGTLLAAEGKGPLKVFILAGDENCLEQAPIDGSVSVPRKGDIKGVTVTNRIGALATVVKENKERWGFLKAADGAWAKRDDVELFDAHPIHNNTKTPGHPLQVGDVLYGGRQTVNAIGPDLMLGHVLGNYFDEPILLLRFATRHVTWFLRGSRSLGADYLPPSSEGGLDLDGSWDVIHFNHGVWDQATFLPNSSQRIASSNGVMRTSIEDYEKNLRTIVARLKQTKATLIWAHTTPILVGSQPGYAGGEMVDKYNAVAAKVMEENGVLIDDLNAECRRMGKPKALNVHDVGDLSPKVTATVLAALKERKNPSRPLPRVLFIGDSITGTYWEKVKQNLDGKAFVAKNPGNAEHSGTGARLINQWVDLKQYLLSGQEYLEFIDGVKNTLKEVNRFCPDFAGRTPELAGMVWFQGIADSQSASQSAAYEKNLAALIRDLRKDLQAPALPVVVAAVAFGGTNMNVNTKKIFDAQMAVGDRVKYPEFAGNVKSVDTRAFVRPAKGQGSCYYENAETFLEIGEVLGQAMTELLKNNTK